MLKQFDWAWDYRCLRAEPGPDALIIGSMLPVVEGHLLPLRTVLTLLTAPKSLEKISLDLSATDLGLASVGEGVASQCLQLRMLACLPKLTELGLLSGEVDDFEVVPEMTPCLAEGLSLVTQLRVLRVDPALLRTEHADDAAAVAAMLAGLPRLEYFSSLEDAQPVFWKMFGKSPAPKLRTLCLCCSESWREEPVAAMVAGMCAQPSLEVLHLALSPEAADFNARRFIESLAGLEASESLQTLHIRLAGEARWVDERETQRLDEVSFRNRIVLANVGRIRITYERVKRGSMYELLESRPGAGYA